VLHHRRNDDAWIGRTPAPHPSLPYAAVAFGVVEPDDQVARVWPALLAGVAALMVVVGLLSCVGPALGGLRIQPTEALKQRG
jgi:hypothetical protein